MLECLQAQLPDGAQRYQIEMRNIGRDGAETELQLDVAISGPDSELGAGRSLRIRATAPADIAGTAYLLRRDGEAPQIFLYLPSQDAARQLMPGQDIPLFGSDLPAGMLLELVLSLRRNAISSTGWQSLNGESLRKLYVTPPPSVASGHMLQVLVAEDPCSLRRMSLVRGGRSELIMDTDPGAFRQGEQAGRQLRIDNPREQTRTILTIREASRPDSLPARLFDPQGFYE